MLRKFELTLFIMNSSFSVMIKKYAVPALFTLMGIGVLVVGFSTNQDTMFNVAAVFLFLAALLSLMYSSGKFKTSLINILGIVAAIAAIATIYFSVKSVSDTKEYMERYELSKLKAEQNLSDIRYIQERHAEVHGKYAPTWEAFLEYAKVATVNHVDAIGTVPVRKMTPEESKFVYKDNRPIDKSMTELEAYILSKSPICPPDLKNFRRDTIKMNLVDVKFKNAAYVDSRRIRNLGAFSLDSLPYIPYGGGKKWKIETKDSVTVADQTFPTIRVSGFLPYAEVQGTKPKEIWFGNLAADDTDGSWE